MPLDEDAATLEALAEIRARIAHEVAALTASARAGFSAGDLIMEIDVGRCTSIRRRAIGEGVGHSGLPELAPPCASNSNLNIAKPHLPHQHMPSGRLPGRHQPHSRPFVSLLVKPQAREIERRWRRSSFDCGGPERRASPRRLKLPLHGQHAEAAMRFANLELSESQSSAGPSIASKRAAKPTAGPAGSELGFLGRLEKRGRSRLASSIGMDLACAVGTSCPHAMFLA